MQSLLQVYLLILLFIEPDISIIPEKWTHKNELKLSQDHYGFHSFPVVD
jgi:hypothetical protein